MSLSMYGFGFSFIPSSPSPYFPPEERHVSSPAPRKPEAKGQYRSKTGSRGYYRRPSDKPGLVFSPIPAKQSRSITEKVLQWLSPGKAQPRLSSRRSPKHWHPQPDSPLLSLPAEIRNQIFSQVLSSPHRIKLNNLRQPPVTLACRQLQNEALCQFFNENTFQLVAKFCSKASSSRCLRPHTHSWLDRVGKDVTSSLHTLTFSIRCHEHRETIADIVTYDLQLKKCRFPQPEHGSSHLRSCHDGNSPSWFKVSGPEDQTRILAGPRGPKSLVEILEWIEDMAATSLVEGLEAEKRRRRNYFYGKWNNVDFRWPANAPICVLWDL